MKLIDVLREECVVANLAMADKQSALEQIVKTAKKCEVLKEIDRQKIIDGLMERESLGSTGFGNGIAIPHCRLEGISDFVVGLITAPAGVDFKALDKKPVKLIVFIVAPQGRSNEHIRLLSSISQALLIPGAVDEMLAETTTQALCESFLRHTRPDINGKDKTNKSLFHVFVQNEDLFRSILEVLASTESSSLVVLDSESTGVYLAKIPLFAGLWHDNPQSFCRIIVALIDKKLANESIRQIETITGNLTERDDIMVTVQDVAYCAGSLGVQS